MKLRYSVLLVFLFLLQTPIFSQKVVFEGLKDINGTQLYCKVVGKGDPLLVVHGGPGLNHNYFLPHLAALEKKYMVIYYDQRSSGASAMNLRENMTLKKFADDMEAIRISFDLDKLNILCHSWSALHVTQFLLHYPESVKAVIYCNPAPLNKKFSTESNRNAMAKTSSADSLKRTQLVASPGFQKGELGIVNELMFLSFKQVFCDTNKLMLLNPALPENYLVASLSLAGFGLELREYDFYASAQNIKVPVLILRGTCDVIPLEADQKLQESIPNAELISFKNSGHFIFIEENELFSKTARKFLKKHK